METLILLPGVGCDGEFWDYQIKYLTDVTAPKVIVLDTQNSLEEMIEHVLADAPEKFSLAGHSSGGWVAQALAAKAPERINKMFLMATFTHANPAFWKAIADWIQRMKNNELEQILDHEIVPFVFHPNKLSNEELIARHQKMKKRMSAEKYVRQLQAMLDHPSVYDCLPKITAKTLIIHGRQDQACDLEEQKLMLKHLKHGALTIIEDCGHMTCMEQPEAVTTLMRLWLSL